MLDQYSKQLGFTVHEPHSSFHNIPPRPYALLDKKRFPREQQLFLLRVEQTRLINHAEIVQYVGGLSICIRYEDHERAKFVCPVLVDEVRDIHNRDCVDWVRIAFHTPRIFRAICTAHNLIP